MGKLQYTTFVSMRIQVGPNVNTFVHRIIRNKLYTEAHDGTVMVSVDSFKNYQSNNRITIYFSTDCDFEVYAAAVQEIEEIVAFWYDNSARFVLTCPGCGHKAIPSNWSAPIGLNAHNLSSHPDKDVTCSSCQSKLKILDLLYDGSPKAGWESGSEDETSWDTGETAVRMVPRTTTTAPLPETTTLSTGFGWDVQDKEGWEAKTDSDGWEAGQQVATPPTPENDNENHEADWSLDDDGISY